MAEEPGLNLVRISDFAIETGCKENGILAQAVEGRLYIWEYYGKPYSHKVISYAGQEELPLKWKLSRVQVLEIVTEGCISLIPPQTFGLTNEKGIFASPVKSSTISDSGPPIYETPTHFIKSPGVQLIKVEHLYVPRNQVCNLNQDKLRPRVIQKNRKKFATTYLAAAYLQENLDGGWKNCYGETFLEWLENQCALHEKYGTRIIVEDDGVRVEIELTANENNNDVSYFSASSARFGKKNGAIETPHK